MDYIPKTAKGEKRDGGENGRGTKSQRGGEVRREWNGEGALGGLRAVLAFLSRGPRVPSYTTGGMELLYGKNFKIRTSTVSG